MITIDSVSRLDLSVAGPGPSLSDWLGDTDDAVRLVTVRELLGGAPWFDTTLPRIGAPEPLVSHWSRLIDLPLAATIGGLTPLLGPERAELATRIVWPALLFLALALIVAREAQRQAGPTGAAFVAMLIATSAVSLVLVALNGRAARRIQPGTLIPGLFLFSGLLFLAEWALRAAAPSWSAILLYLHVSAASPKSRC